MKLKFDLKKKWVGEIQGVAMCVSDLFPLIWQNDN